MKTKQPTKHEFARIVVDLMENVPDFKVLAEDKNKDSQSKSKEFVQYIAYGIHMDVIPKSIAKSALTQYIKMKKAMTLEKKI